ncbi:fibronectin-binding protein [Ligilactobacillus salitolerans]|uniref:Fibronectin-binding protein n=1 Tax=Ligilactobacillus salitolerans TaxID=1808352 RepID=A0A401IQW1_9LACO|nr:FusB/FusC family EF-G-binding protein [Ligilactobacillus salitolerans]GBG93903.1 fibronectin-binding protein [Ligilactobacillus salitolerans]
MKTTLQPYQFMHLQAIVANLIHNYESVNDYRTIGAIQSLAAEEIRELLAASQIDTKALLDFVMDQRLRRRAAEKYLSELKEHVIPFEQPTKKQVEKVFRKTKKLKVPDFSAIDLRENTFIGWNDLGTQKKFLLFYQGERLAGTLGDISNTAIKGFCSICHHEANVVLFTAVSKKAGDGRYTKKGNYICLDSSQCNRQLYQREDLDNFLQKLK